MASPDELLAMLEEAAEEAEHARTQEQMDEDEEPEEFQVVEDIMDELVDEIALGLCFEVHRACKIGTFLMDDTDKESEKKFGIVIEKGVDVFGQVPMKKQLECVCPNCQRNLAASRFAPHLEKCMGMGRNSSRIASRRIANTGKKDDSDNESEENIEDDWSYTSDRRAKKLKRDKKHDSPRKNKSSKAKNGNTGDISGLGCTGSDSVNYAPAFISLSLEERKALLLQNCGVISEHTKKMCTRSQRCPQHTEDQRRAVRLYLLGQQRTGMDNDDIHVDIDTYEDGDAQALRDSLQWEAASNPSPADSTSTTNSTSSRKKKSSRSSKKKSSNNHKSPSAGTPSSLFDFQ